jgi:hypothetical protein
MILVSLCLIGFGVTDLLRWSPECAAPRRTVLAVVGAVMATGILAALSDMPLLGLAITEAAVALVISAWVLLDRPGRRAAGYQLAWVSLALLAAVSLSSLAQSASGPLRDWYSSLHLGFVRTTTLDEFMLGSGAALFALATSNRIVRLILRLAWEPNADKEPPEELEEPLTGGRILGPMERLLVGAMVLSGGLVAAGALIAAKGLLRLPEIRSNTAQKQGASDQITEYFLIGTFSSLLLASGLAVAVLAAS